jgi:tRNA(Arg) A34 adenosine deaminase TadA
MKKNIHEKFISRAIKLSKKGMEKGLGGPFGCVIVKDGIVIAQATNMVTSANDPTAHAEIVAIRKACKKLGSFQLTDCDIYTSCEPCPMCLGAIYWARPKAIYYANTKEDAAAIEFDDDFIYKEINTAMANRKIPFIHYPHLKAKAVFDAWKNLAGKTKY